MGHAAEVRHERDSEHNGTVVKTPTFYEDYVGPRIAQLDVVKATGTLGRNGSFRFLGVNQGVIELNVRATYRGSSPGKFAPLHGPQPLALPVPFQARGRSGGVDEYRQLRT
jgi:hypothetical protein